MTAKEKLTALADSIREKTGATGLLSLDAMTEAVKAFEGGGLPTGWATGTFNTTAATMSGNIQIEHGLGAIPDVVVIFKELPERVTGSVRGAVRFNFGEEFDEELGYYPNLTVQHCFGDSSSSVAKLAGSVDYDDNRETFTVPALSSSYVYVPAFTYRWIAIRLEG